MQHFPECDIDDFAPRHRRDRLLPPGLDPIFHLHILTRQAIGISGELGGAKGDEYLKSHPRPSRTVSAEHRQKPFSYRAAELRAKELQTVAFFLIVAYFAILAHAVFS
jgi:hypothetical protein